MTESIYKEYQNKYYNPNDNDKRPGDNDNWKSIQEGFHRIGSTQLETSAGLTLGKGTADEISVTPAELEEIKNPSQLETSGGLTLGKGTADEVSVTAGELGEIVNGKAPVIIPGEDQSVSIQTGAGNLGNNIRREISGLKPNTNYMIDIIVSFSVYGIIGSVINHIRRKTSTDAGTIVISSNPASSFEVTCYNLTNSPINASLITTFVVYEV